MYQSLAWNEDKIHSSVTQLKKPTSTDTETTHVSIVSMKWGRDPLICHSAKKAHSTDTETTHASIVSMKWGQDPLVCHSAKKAHPRLTLRPLMYQSLAWNEDEIHSSVTQLTKPTRMTLRSFMYQSLAWNEDEIHSSVTQLKNWHWIHPCINR